MKLRNNKTGEVKAVNHAKILVHFSDGTTDAFNSLKELTDKYSDCTEPLIKDEKIRKAFRAWAKACNIPNDAKLDVFEYLGTGKTAIQYAYEAKTKPYKRCVQFEYISSDKVYNSQNDRVRTIVELCGEEEE